MIFRKIKPIERYTFKVKNGIYYWGNNIRERREIIVAEINGLAVGVLSYSINNTKNSNFIDVGIVSVHPIYQSIGYARGMLNVLFELAKSLNKGIEVTAYSEEGELKLMPMFLDLSRRYNVDLKH